jgi:hypothetical protein
MENEITLADKAIYDKIHATLVAARRKVYSAVNQTMVEAYWEIGRQIMEAQNNNARAEYGAGLIRYLAERLTAEFGKGFDENRRSVPAGILSPERPPIFWNFWI